jgi:hypothetical protein
MSKSEPVRWKGDEGGNRLTGMGAFESKRAAAQIQSAGGLTFNNVWERIDYELIRASATGDLWILLFLGRPLGEPASLAGKLQLADDHYKGIVETADMEGVTRQ